MGSRHLEDFDKNRRDSKPTLNRRELLQGKLWKRVDPSGFRPLVMRYPTSREDLQPSTSAAPSQGQPPMPVRSIAGIVIEPVAATPNLGTQHPRSIPVLRPPGAIEESQFLQGCTRCNDCADACPYDAIRKAPERLPGIAGTPVIEADSAACMMCADFPCIRACQPGVLVEALSTIMGTAKITAHLCLAHHGTTCTLCSERCPVEGAIELDAGKPTVREATCTGCGVCRHICPAPENAILLMPIFNRPSLPHP